MVHSGTAQQLVFVGPGRKIGIVDVAGLGRSPRAAQLLEPVTLTTHRHPDGACTMICWLPVPVCGVTDCPDGAELVTAGAGPAAAPDFTTNTANVGVAAGTGAHANAQPMFHVPPAMVNALLVQFPASSVAGINTVGGPTAWATVVDVADEPPGAAVVVVDPPADAVVDVVDLPAAVVVVVDEGGAAGGGILNPPVEPELPVVSVADPVLPLNHMPNTAARTTAMESCQVFHERRPTIWREPGSVRPSSSVDRSTGSDPLAES